MGVDTLGLLAEKLDKLVDDTQGHYESFVDANTLYKSGKMTEREFLTKLGEYTVTTSALEFLSVKVIMELKKALDRIPGSESAGMQHPPSMPPGMGMPGQAGMMPRMGTADAPVGAPQVSGQSFESPGTLPSPDPSLISAPESGGGCPSCGAQLRPGAKFCTKCGARV